MFGSSILRRTTALGRVELAFFDMLNAKGGVSGRRVRLISLDDAYSPPKTVEQTLRAGRVSPCLAPRAPSAASTVA